MFMTTNIADEDANTVSEQSSFTPRYPVYDVDNMAMNATAQLNNPNVAKEKRRRRKKKAQLQQQQMECVKEKMPVESPVQI